MKKIIINILIFLIVVVFAINILTITNIPLFNFRIYRVGSGSMEPYLSVNDIILVQKEKKYKINDVVTYMTTNNEYITHRIIQIEKDSIITKGDANNLEDEPIKANNIIGKVIFKITKLGFIFYLFREPISWILLLITGLIITKFIPDKKQ